MHYSKHLTVPSPTNLFYENVSCNCTPQFFSPQIPDPTAIFKPGGDIIIIQHNHQWLKMQLELCLDIVSFLFSSYKKCQKQFSHSFKNKNSKNIDVYLKED